MIDIVLHAGIGKAGSTRIQEVLHRNRRALAERRIFVPDETNRHHVLAFIAQGRAAEAPANSRDLPFGGRTRAALEAAVRDLEAAASSGSYDRLLLSNEHVFRFDGADLARLTGFLRGIGASLATIVYLRDYASHAVSAINQNIKNGKRDIAFYLEARKWSPFRSLLPAFEEAVGASAFRLFAYEARSFPQGDIARHFFEICGIDPRGLELELARTNASISHEAALIGSALNRLYFERHGRTRFQDGLGLRAALAAIPGERFRVPDEAFARFVDFAREDTAFVLQRYGIDVPVMESQPERAELWQPHTIAGVAELILTLAEATETADKAASAGLLDRLRQKLKDR